MKNNCSCVFIEYLACIYCWIKITHLTDPYPSFPQNFLAIHNRAGKIMCPVKTYKFSLPIFPENRLLSPTIKTKRLLNGTYETAPPFYNIWSFPKKTDESLHISGG